MGSVKNKKYPELRKLKARMVEAGETYRTLSEKVKIPLVTLNNKINGHSQFNIAEAVEVCNVLKIDINQIKYFFT